MTNYRVMLIDDEPWTREVLRSLGEWQELHLTIVGEASDGKSGLEMIRQQQPDIVLTDIKMPLLSGLELMHQLRQTDARTRVIMVSGYDDFTFVRDAMRMSATDYLLKPVKADELNAQLRKAIDELDAMIAPKQPVDVSGFMAAPWMPQYLAQRSILHSMLTTGDAANVVSTLNNMESLISPVPTQALLIALYYDLLGMLERHVVAVGYPIEAVLRDNGIVFGGNTSLSEVIEHVRMQYSAAIAKLASLMKDRRSLDIEQVLSYVQAHADEGVALEQTARQFFVTREYLSKLFKSRTGKSFSEYVTTLRMDRAKEMLQNGTAAKELYAALGFSETAHFYKVFKRYFGVTPGEMQKQVKNKQ